MVGDHHNVKRRLGIWLRPERWALVSFLYFILSSKPEAFSQNKPSHVPQLAVVPLVRPPKRVLLKDLEILELRAHAPAFVVCQRVPVFLEKGVDPRNAAIPRVFQILQGEAAILGLGLLPLQGVLCPHALRVDKLGLPWLQVAKEVGDELVLVMGHARAEVCHAHVRLLTVAQVALRD
eukprot:scaffold1754_cov355-Prasinococcus_capsulatus_cf.AAC.2